MRPEEARTARLVAVARAALSIIDNDCIWCRDYASLCDTDTPNCEGAILRATLAQLRPGDVPEDVA